MTIYKPMTPKLRNEINYAYKKQMDELDTCENNEYVQLLKSTYSLQLKLLNSLPDGYLIPFTERGG